AELLRAGARAARPGEFTLRGFLAGKLDLTRAEAVLGVVEAGSRAELKQALALLAGGGGRARRRLRGGVVSFVFARGGGARLQRRGSAIRRPGGPAAAAGEGTRPGNAGRQAGRPAGPD